MPNNVSYLRGRKRWTTRRTSFTPARRKSGAIISRFFPLFAFLSQLRDSPRIFHAANWVASGCETVHFMRKNGGTVRPRCVPLAVPRQVPPWRSPRAVIGVKKNSTRPVKEEREKGSERERKRKRAFVRLSRVRLDSSQPTQRALRTISDAYRIHSDDDDAPFFLLLHRPHSPAVLSSPRIPPSSHGSQSLFCSWPPRLNRLVKRPSSLSLSCHSSRAVLCRFFASFFARHAVHGLRYATERESRLFLRMGNDLTLFLEETLINVERWILWQSSSIPGTCTSLSNFPPFRFSASTFGRKVLVKGTLAAFTYQETAWLLIASLWDPLKGNPIELRIFIDHSLTS